jgi:hypothetical protein
MTDTPDTPDASAAEEPAPAQVLELSGDEAAALADLAAMFEELQTALVCCERLMAELGAKNGQEPDTVTIESLWTTTLLCYARCFATGSEHGTRLTEEDLDATGLQGKVREWHQKLVALKDHYTDPTANPRESFSVGASQDSDGEPNGIAITSNPEPIPDEQTVRQTGAIAYALSKLIDERVSERQKELLEATQSMSRDELAKLPRIQVNTGAGDS